ncbi:hypothetical protein [Corallococcus exiguus]|uniref:Uncharacterized protein n=1 Tax=Corallococcus exiguus TaxID=83462 RepID=A0A7X5BQX3_9BACT|nr:hypothetical protein [Corallococcus exiguus]NBC42601.1 hypothetical protein [Corallococcus exiguus]TNV63549.1 hypothetical protein FH620_14930 [Corallococcus exiguus]
MHFRTVRGWCLGLLLTLSAPLAFAAEPPSQGVVLAAEPLTFAEAKVLPDKLTGSAACDLGPGKTADITVSQTVEVTQAIPDFCRPAEAVITQTLSLPDGSHVERGFRIVDDAPGTQLPPQPPRPRIRVRCEARRLELAVEGVPEAPLLTLEPIGTTATATPLRLRVPRDSEARILPLLIRDDAGARRALEELDFLVGKGVPSRLSGRDTRLPEADSVAGLAAALERARNHAVLAAGGDLGTYIPRDVLAPDLEADRPPLKTGAPETIGELQPPEPDSTADSDLFWRQGRLCVVQQDTGKRMRCYDPVARRWGKAVSVNRGEQSAWSPRVGRCGIPLGARNVRPPENFQPELRLSPRAVLLWSRWDHEALVMEVPEGNGPPRLRAPEAEELKKAVLASTGSRLLGEGRFILDEDRKQFCSVRRPLGCWSLRWEGRREDEGPASLSEASVSPDGRWIAYLRGPAPSKADSDDETRALVVRSLELGPYVAPREPVSTAPRVVRTDVVMEKPVWGEPALGENDDRLFRARISCDLGQDARIPFELEKHTSVSQDPWEGSAGGCRDNRVQMHQELTVPGGLTFVRRAFAVAGDRQSPEGDVKVRCQPGRLSLWIEGVPDFPALSLTANMGAFGAVRWDLAPETETRLQALLARDDAPALDALDAFARLVKLNDDAREVSAGMKPNDDGHVSRMGCLATALEAISARRALADGVHPEQHALLKTDGMCAERYGMRALQQRLQAATLPLPLRVGALKGKAQVIGRVRSVPSIPPERQPQLYWRAGTLCLVQEDGTQQVRCYDPAARKWGPAVARQDRPFPREDLLLKSQDVSGPCYPLGGRSIPTSEDVRDVLPLSSRASLFADTSRGALAPEFKVIEVPEGAGPVRTRAPTVEELALAARAGAGSASLGEGRFLLHGSKNERSSWLCTAVRPWMCWNLDLESEAYAVLAAMASPDGRWLSYVRISREKPYTEELVLLPLTPGP